MFEYKPHFIPNSVVLVGAGGTGSRLMPGLVQLIRTCVREFNPAAWIPKLPLYVFDADMVETKNLLRQNFIQQDVGRNKAVVVADRYSQAFGVPVIPIPHFLDNSLAVVVQGPEGPLNVSQLFKCSIIILAVDSAAARREILARIAIVSEAMQFVIDAGNEDDFGQVKFFTNHALWTQKQGPTAELWTQKQGPTAEFQKFITTFPEQIPCAEQVDYIPFDYEYYAELGSSAQELSCADLPQTLAINTAMATLILTVVQNFLQVRPMNFDCVRFSMNGSMGAERNTVRSWSQRLRPLKDYGSVVGPSEYLKHSLGVYADSEQDPFKKLRAKCVETFSEAGLLLAKDGTLTPKAVPKLKEEPKKVKPKADGPPKLEPIQLNVEPVLLQPPA